LRTPTEIPVISDSSVSKWILDQIESGDSSVVKLSLDSKSRLTLVKISLNPQFAELIRRKAVILKTMKPTLIVELLDINSDLWHHNSVIVTEFAGNGKLANHLSPAEFPLSGTNRITRIIVGIILTMRFLHFQNFIHLHLESANTSLDWD
jgi:serine/threonine protein kinase